MNIKIQKNGFSKIYLAIIGALILLLFVVIMSFLLSNNGLKKQQGTITPTVTPLPSNFEADYSRLRLLKPGISTLQDVIKINGNPSSTTRFGDKTLLYYQTPSFDYKNEVLVINDVVVYALDNVFSDRQGYYSNYISKYGQPDFVLYGDDINGFPWYVFLKQGLVIQSSNNSISAIIYFAPQSEALFMRNIALNIGLKKEQIIPSGPLGEPLIKESTPEP